MYPGDPTTPGFPSYEDANRTSGENIPSIPSLPISWANAQVLLGEIESGANRVVRLVNHGAWLFHLLDRSLSVLCLQSIRRLHPFGTRWPTSLASSRMRLSLLVITAMVCWSIFRPQAVYNEIAAWVCLWYLPVEGTINLMCAGYGSRRSYIWNRLLG